MFYKDLHKELEAYNWHIEQLLNEINKQNLPTYEQLKTIRKTASKIVESIEEYCSNYKEGE